MQRGGGEYPGTSLWKLPPPAKVYEAFSAIADGRVRIEGPGRASVLSSAGDKTYTVEWTGDFEAVGSNDNASYWQGYLGYPIVAVLLAAGKLEADETVTKALAGIDWHALNVRFKRDYPAAVAHVLSGLAERGGDPSRVEREAELVMEQLAALKLERAGRGRRPPERG
jgi:hypothetical protein